LAAVDLDHPPAEARADAAAMKRNRLKPEGLCFTRWPVLPADLRPLVPLEGGRFATSDLNDLYRTLINRNNRTRRLIELGAPEIILRNEVRLMQESLDCLVENDVPGRRKKGPNERVLVSLSEFLSGERGLFSRAASKRVDYSGLARALR
jgi:DNA-directed RNA polymerase subunit beta'